MFKHALITVSVLAALLPAVSLAEEPTQTIALAANSLGNKAAIQLTSLKVADTAEKNMGRVTASLPCNDSNGREWSELLARRVGTELNAVFVEEMKLLSKNNTPVNVQAELGSMDLQVCNFGGGAWKGEMTVKLNWESKAQGSDKAAYLVSTSGTFNQSVPAATPGVQAVREALRMAVRKLAKDQGFAALTGEYTAVDLASIK